MTHPLSYSEMVAKLAKPGADIITQMTAHQAHLLHMAVGLAGEATEAFLAYCELLEPVNGGHQELAARRKHLIKEIGDCEFYLEGLRQGLPNVTFYGDEWENPLHPVRSSADAGVTLLVHTGILLDAVKKHAINSMRLDTSAIRDCVFYIESAIDYYCVNQNTSREEARARNMDKLAKRYPGFEYSNQAAPARADKGAE